MANEIKEPLPAFVTDAWHSACERIDAWAKGAPLFTLAMITDVHTGNNDRYRQLGYLDGIADVYSFDLLGNFGDIGLDFSADPTVETDEERERILALTKAGMDPSHRWIFIKGNHDRMLPREKLAVLNRDFAEKWKNIRFGTSLCDYGAVDFPEKKVRFLFLDTSDNDERVHFSITEAQLRWFIGELAACPAGWRVIAGSHFSPDPTIGKWRSYPTDGEFAEMRALRKILPAFVSRAAGGDEETGIAWDFRDAKADLLCVLSGDSHFNADIRRDGVRYIIRQGYGGVGVSEMPEGATKDPFDFHECVNFDVLALKENGDARLFRVGAGAGIRDLDVNA